ncbi:MAG: hypothetical protein PVI62_05445 [Desulfobacterales bacterium]|jgi:hypothetical protein
MTTGVNTAWIVIPAKAESKDIIDFQLLLLLFDGATARIVLDDAPIKLYLFQNTVIPKAQVSYTGFEDNPLRGGMKLAHKGA